MAMKFELQEHLGKYPIVREIGSGATSRVYLARDPFADRDVAIKVFLFADNVNPQTERMMHKRSEEHTSELQSLTNLVCRLLLEIKNNPLIFAPSSITEMHTPHLYYYNLLILTYSFH